MQFSFFPASLLLSLAAAQSADPSQSTACAGQAVLTQCLASTKLIVAQCGTTDWGCLCQKWSDVLTCFTASGCSEDVGISSAQSSRDTYCANASIYTSSTSSATSSDVPRTTTSTTATGTNTGSTSAQTAANNGDVRVASSSSATGSAAAATQSGNAARKDLVLGAGSAMMGLAGLVGAFL